MKPLNFHQTPATQGSGFLKYEPWLGWNGRLAAPRWICVVVMAMLGLAGSGSIQRAIADEVPETSAVASVLQKTTVTLRISPVVVPADADNAQSPQTVTVLSGVSLGNGWIVTFATMPATARYRVTLPDGGQDIAKPRVIDFYSGLTLLQIEEDELPGLAPVARPVKVGESVLTAAAAGIEPPVVSLGILGATDRTLSNSNLPPLLQCDVRTTDTSSGAALVNRYGELIGIVAVAAVDTQPTSWTYAIPVRHVQRLLRAKADDKLVVLQRQRPTVGLTLETDGESLRIERVTPGGPADQAGLRKGGPFWKSMARRSGACIRWSAGPCANSLGIRCSSR